MLYLDAVQLVRVDLGTLRTDYDCRFEVGLRLSVLKWTVVWHAGTLCLDLGKEEACRTVGVGDAERRIACVPGMHAVDDALQAMREHRTLITYRQIIYDDPSRFYHRKFVLARRILAMIWMALQYETPPRIDLAHATYADEPFGP